jgi:plasmid stabilization system protein ParE
MGKPVSVHPLVHHDVASIFDYIAEDDPVAADRVARTIFRQFPKFGAHPGIGTPYPADAPELAGIRLFPVPRYRNYLVFYVERGDEIRILYVYHSSRNIREQMDKDVRR